MDNVQRDLIEYNELLAKNEGLTKGDRVIMLKGKYKGKEAKYISRENNIAVLELEISNKIIELSFPIYALEKN